MTRPHALSLSDQQLAIVTQGARFIPCNERIQPWPNAKK
jgi:hypothetical protein